MTTTPQTNATLAEIAEVLRTGDDFVICGHVSPDGDCLGSQLALHHALLALGKRSQCVLARDEPVEASLGFLPGIGDLVFAGAYDGPCGVFVGVDAPSRERIGEHASSIHDRCGVSVTVDHHASETTMCDYVYVDPDSASASILVWELAKLLVGKPSYESALCAYTGLVTDTGGFRYQNTNSVALNAAAELLEYGIDPSFVASETLMSRTLASLKLEERVIGRMQFVADGAGVLSWVCRDDLQELGAQKSDTEPLVNVLRSVRGVRVACMLREQDGSVRGSLRSKDDTDVAALARELGGGGHKAAAGLTLDMQLDEAVALMTLKMTEILA